MRPAVRKSGDTGSADLERACVATFHRTLVSLLTQIAFGSGYRDGFVVFGRTGGWHVFGGTGGWHDDRCVVGSFVGIKEWWRGVFPGGGYSEEDRRVGNFAMLLFCLVEARGER